MVLNLRSSHSLNWISGRPEARCRGRNLPMGTLNAVRPGVNAIGSKSHLNSIAIRLVAGEDSSTITTIDPPSTIHTAIFHFMGDLLTLIRVCDVFVMCRPGQ